MVAAAILSPPPGPLLPSQPLAKYPTARSRNSFPDFIFLTCTRTQQVTSTWEAIRGKRLRNHDGSRRLQCRPSCRNNELRGSFSGCEVRASEKTSSVVEDEWLQKLPDKKKPLYSHSLPCIEAWLKNLGFYQSKDDRAVWHIERADWNAQLSLDVTDLYIRYLKSGPGNLERDVERKFSYALCREDLENAILGGP